MEADVVADAGTRKTSASSLWFVCSALVAGAFALSAAVFVYRTYYRAKSVTVRIGTRTSQLALWQAEHVAQLIRGIGDGAPDVRVLGLVTSGDVDQIKPLTEFGAKGVFTKELDAALCNGVVDVAVHCMKDLPTTLPTGIVTAAVLTRGSVEDVLILHPRFRSAAATDLSALPNGARIGTSALRRRAAVNARFPHLSCTDIRGNINTRIAKLDRGEFDAVILAKTGLERLGMTDRISAVLPAAEYGYAVGQGALAVCCRDGDERVLRLMAPFDDATTRLECEAERGMLRTLNGGCKVPIAVNSHIRSADADQYAHTLDATVFSVDGGEQIRYSLTRSYHRPDNAVLRLAALESAKQLGEQVGNELRIRGADKLLTSSADANDDEYK